MTNQTNWSNFLQKWLNAYNAVDTITDETAFFNFTSILTFAYFEAYQISVITYVVLSTIICFFGIFSNITCLIAICTYPPLRHRGNILVGNFVLINVILSAFAYPMSLVFLFCKHYCDWPTDNCEWAYFYYFFLHSITWQECFLALNRFLAIILPHQYRYVSTKKAIILSVFMGYLIPFILNIAAKGDATPMYRPTPPFGGCLYNRNANTNFLMAHAVVGVYIPMSVVGTAYVLIFIRVGVSRYLKKRHPGGVQSASMNRRVTLAKMFFASFIWYCLTYLPHPIMTAALPSIYFFYPVMYFYARWALFAGAAANAIVYAITNKDYRHGMMFVLKCKFNTGRKTEPTLVCLKDKGIPLAVLSRNEQTAP